MPRANLIGFRLGTLNEGRGWQACAVDALRAAGFRSDDISVLMPDRQSSEEFAHEKNTMAPEGTTTGVATGGAVGGTLGLLAGLGALAIPGVGPLIAAGPIMGAWRGLAPRGRGWTRWRSGRDGHSRIRSETV